MSWGPDQALTAQGLLLTVRMLAQPPYVHMYDGEERCDTAELTPPILSMYPRVVCCPCLPS